MLERLT